MHLLKISISIGVGEPNAMVDAHRVPSLFLQLLNVIC
jgi:hypothetical protein